MTVHDLLPANEDGHKHLHSSAQSVPSRSFRRLFIFFFFFFIFFKTFFFCHLLNCFFYLFLLSTGTFDPILALESDDKRGGDCAL